MVKFLLVGDPHVTVSELEDCNALLQLVSDTASKHQVDAVVFLGDQHHTHDVVHQEVLDFWRDWLTKLSGPRIALLTGNHDRSRNSALKSSTLWPYSKIPRVTVVDEPFVLADGIGLLSWKATQADFRNELTQLQGVKTLICHQTFTGGKYENGFYAPDGFSLDGLEQLEIVSGHIHSPQSFANVWYPGSPRWRTLSDAGTERAIWVVAFDDNGTMTSRFGVPTRGVCRQIQSLRLVEGAIPSGLDADLWKVAAPADLLVSLHGTQPWIDGMRGYVAKTIANPAIRVLERSFATRPPRPGVRESEGLQEALNRFVGGYQSAFGTEAPLLQKMVSDRVQL